MQHEKYTSQLQLSLKALEARAKEKLQLQSSEKTRGSVSNVKVQDRTERKAHSLTGNKRTEHSPQQERRMKTESDLLFFFFLLVNLRGQHDLSCRSLYKEVQLL